MSSEKKKILIVVKTYPTPSTRYREIVCTAGVDEDGNWIENPQKQKYFICPNPVWAINL